MTLAAAVMLCAVALAGGAWLVHRRWLVVEVRGGSMAPTLRDGQQLLARRGRGYLRGDMVVFRAPRPDGSSAAGDPPYRSKRVAAVAGEPVPPWLATRAGVAGHRRVPAHHLAVSGDHPVSEDSRHFGFVPDDAVLGYVRSRARPAPPTSSAGHPQRADDAVGAAAPAAGSARCPARARTCR